jgi:hypothetical protein
VHRCLKLHRSIVDNPSYRVSFIVKSVLIQQFHICGCNCVVSNIVDLSTQIIRIELYINGCKHYF